MLNAESFDFEIIINILFREHLLSSHLNLALYQCELCSAKLKDVTSYKHHIQTVHDVQVGTSS